jgi:hypothetical protein
MPGGSGDATWNRLWKLKVPPKVKVFWWKVLHEFLPTKSVLHQRHIEPLPYCDICGAERETTLHVMTECTLARVFWREIKLMRGVKLPSVHPQSWASDILCPEVCAEGEKDLLINGMYSIWLQRNQRRHDEPQIPLRAAAQWAVDTAYDLWQLSQAMKKEKSNAVRQRWNPPPAGWHKCNVDGALTMKPAREQPVLSFGIRLVALRQAALAGMLMALMR